MVKGPHTIVVGGGLAGLRIAHRLALQEKDDEHNILVLEQYGVWGGRVATHHKDGLTYEIGAGRIFKGHKRVADLVKHFKLKTYPISTKSFTAHNEPNPFLSLFEPIRHVLSKCDEKTLAENTIYDLVPPEFHDIFQYYPYWAEVHMMRADLALPLFAPTDTMGAHTDHDFYGIKGGMDQLTKGLYDQCKEAGVALKDKHKVAHIKRLADGLFEVSGDDFSYKPQRVIIATTRGEYPMFSVLNNTPMLKQLAMSPLTRIYAVYPKNPATGKVWFTDKKMVVDDPLRYIIPINPESGLIMISYTDGTDTKVWKDLDGKDLENAIQADLKHLFPEETIPEPTYLKKHEWIYGCTYWLPAPGNYEPHKALLDAQNPSKNLYVCGESVSLVQGWMEGALESADSLADRIKNRNIK